MKTDTKTLIGAMRILAHDIQSDDGIVNSVIAEAIAEAADRLGELVKQRDMLREALLKLRTGGCFCLKGIGHPQFSDHSKDCQRATEALAKTEGWQS